MPRIAKLCEAGFRQQAGSEDDVQSMSGVLQYRDVSYGSITSVEERANDRGKEADCLLVEQETMAVRRLDRHHLAATCTEREVDDFWQNFAIVWAARLVTDVGTTSVDPRSRSHCLGSSQEAEKQIQDMT